MATVKVSGKVGAKLRGKTDWERLRNLTDAEIRIAMASDAEIKNYTRLPLPEFSKAKGK